MKYLFELLLNYSKVMSVVTEYIYIYIYIDIYIYIIQNRKDMNKLVGILSFTNNSFDYVHTDPHPDFG